MSISPNVVILTLDELRTKEDAAFQRGVKRGKFEALRLKEERASTDAGSEEHPDATEGARWWVS